MPAGLIDRSGYSIAACRSYAQPLIKGDTPPPYRADGVPASVPLKLLPVAKKLPT